MSNESVEIRFDSRAVDWLRAVVSVASNRRLSIDCVQVCAGGSLWSPVLGDFDGVTLVATDSFRLLSVAFPLDGGLVDVSGHCESVVLPLRDVKLPAGSSLVLSSGRELNESYGQIGVEVIAKNGGVFSQSLRYDPAAQYPNYRNLMPANTVGNSSPFAVNGALVGPLLTAMSKAVGKDGAQIPIRFVGNENENKPARFDCVGAGFAASAIVMPVRIPDGRGVLGHLREAVGVSA